ncbi:PA-phosphatase-like phosphoesterase [Catenovulum agarivorans DS-2]|uniref:undecaprenyl-diphosphate phosphatase n=1 Tax=Catenovulum agarivorans DS-2 TaxID=1328313 RepID=W7Q6R3_9ALTE|nr:phosphatase PAP2 family protein [Catenovulum agarivorans]EWH08479.1 PA-phosphatase-like phosphoesterase [Catenovulum agarivorans DS-2]
MNIITQKDQQLFGWIFSHTQNRDMKWVRLISKTGDGHFYIALAILLALLEHEGIWFLAVGLVAFLMELPSYFMLKKAFKRARPSDLLVSAHIEPSDKFSLPSGHTAAAFLMATLISAFYPSYTVLAYSWASFIGLSRVLLGVHFPTDIIAGALLGMVSAWLSLGWIL